MKKIYNANNLREVYFLKLLLEGNDIPIYISGENAYPNWGFIPLELDDQLAVWIINDDDWEKAKELIEHYEEQERSGVQGDRWRCSKCGENLEPQFTQCWLCGTLRSEEEEVEK